MSVKSDRWIRKMAVEHRMIEPFADKQVREGVISYGLSSYGYDARIADEFKIFTNINSHRRRPQGLRPALVRGLQGEAVHHPAELLRPRAHGRVLPDPAKSVRGLRRKVQL